MCVARMVVACRAGISCRATKFIHGGQRLGRNPKVGSLSRSLARWNHPYAITLMIVERAGSWIASISSTNPMLVR